MVDGCGDKRGGGGGGGGRGIYWLDAVRCSTGRLETLCCWRRCLHDDATETKFCGRRERNA